MADNEYKFEGTNLADITSHHISDKPKIYTPARNNAFQFVVPKSLESILQDPADTSNYLSSIQEYMKVAVVEASIPNFKVEPIEVRRGNSTVRLAGMPSFDAGSLKLEDYVDARIKDILYQWQALVYDVKTDVVFEANNYKFNCELIEYSPDFSRELRRWELIGCWVSDISDEAFNHESRDKRTLSATIQYDRAIRKYDSSDISFNKDDVVSDAAQS